jgi:hypothetical protein
MTTLKNTPAPVFWHQVATTIHEAAKTWTLQAEQIALYRLSHDYPLIQDYAGEVSLTESAGTVAGRVVGRFLLNH